MARSQSAVAHYSVYIVIRLVVCALQSFSLETGRDFARGLAWLAYRLDRRHRNVALDNLRRALPGHFPEQELHRLVKEVFRHFFNVMVEMVHLPRKLNPRNWRRYIRVENGRGVIECLLSGRPLLIVTGHLGNWEMAGVLLAMMGFKSYAVARPLSNPYLDRFVRKFRQYTGQQLLAKKGEVDRMQDILKSGGVICTLADQDAGKKGLFVDFFGRPASTHKGIALLALEHRASLVVAGTRKVGEPMRYVVEIADVIHPADYEDRPDALRYVTQRYTTALERMVRKDLCQYFWVHERWKRQPGQRRSPRAIRSEDRPPLSAVGSED